MNTRLSVIAIICFFIAYNCSSDSENPTITLTAPQDGDTVRACVTVLSADADDNDQVEYVEFYVDNGAIGTDSASPYEGSWSIAGYDDMSSHSLYAVAFDHADNSAQSDVIVVMVATCGMVSGVNSDTVYIIDNTYALVDVQIADAPDSAIVDSIAAVVTILHQQISDVDIYLQSPGGSEHQLWNNDFVMPTDTMVTTAFSDEDVNGTWLLRVFDEVGNGLVGYISNFTIEIYWKY